MSISRCSAADITLERIRQVVEAAEPESLTLEYKKAYTGNIVKSIAAMANSYGGVILVGVTDDRQLEGVDEGAIVQVVNSCHGSLEPPWQPEIVPVAMGEGRFVLVIRVDPAQAPRPLIINGAAPIRLHGRTATADRQRLSWLFQEGTVPSAAVGRVMRPTGAPSEVAQSFDFVLRSGMVFPVAEAQTWRPLSERHLDALGPSLDASSLGSTLAAWSIELGFEGFRPFHRAGHNRSRRARLVWAADAGPEIPRPIDAVATIGLTDEFGLPGSTLTFTVDVVSHLRLVYEQIPHLPDLPTHWLTPGHLHRLCDAMISTLTTPDVVAILADLAGIDPVTVPQPRTLDFLSDDDVRDLLDLTGLQQIPDSTSSHGANLIADPSIDLGDPLERLTQIDSWLTQIGSDAGLRGMDRLVADLDRPGASGDFQDTLSVVQTLNDVNLR